MLIKHFHYREALSLTKKQNFTPSYVTSKRYKVLYILRIVFGGICLFFWLHVPEHDPFTVCSAHGIQNQCLLNFSIPSHICEGMMRGFGLFGVTSNQQREFRLLQSWHEGRPKNLRRRDSAHHKDHRPTLGESRPRKRSPSRSGETNSSPVDEIRMRSSSAAYEK